MHNAGLLASRYPDHGKGEAEAREPRIVTGHKVYQVENVTTIVQAFCRIPNAGTTKYRNHSVTKLVRLELIGEQQFISSFSESVCDP